MREAIEAHGGSVEKFIGDAVMADVRRAERARGRRAPRLSRRGRDPRSAWPRWSRDPADRGVAIEWRTGIDTGEVVAGDVAAGQRIVTGDAVNVAARLEQAARRARS